jgi:general secretion pathway protein B
MSYILDALKKSEQQRGQGSIPNVQTVHSSSLNYRDENKSYWPYILITAVTLNLAAIVYFIIDKDTISENSALSDQDTVGNNSEQHIVLNNTATVAPAATPESQIKQVRNTTGTNTNIEPEKPTIVVPAQAESIAKTSSPTNDDEIIAPRYNNNSALNKRQVQAQKNIIDFYDLPASIQQQLPAIIVSAHIYSTNPLQRSIVINNNFMEEGEYVIDNLILHEITADGAIFDYGETRFSYGVVSGWQ